PAPLPDPFRDARDARPRGRAGPAGAAATPRARPVPRRHHQRTATTADAAPGDRDPLRRRGPVLRGPGDLELAGERRRARAARSARGRPHRPRQGTAVERAPHAEGRGGPSGSAARGRRPPARLRGRGGARIRRQGTMGGRGAPWLGYARATRFQSGCDRDPALRGGSGGARRTAHSQRGLLGAPGTPGLELKAQRTRSSATSTAEGVRLSTAAPGALRWRIWPLRAPITECRTVSTPPPPRSSSSPRAPTARIVRATARCRAPIAGANTGAATS